jgi:hypothetical protein
MKAPEDMKNETRVSLKQQFVEYIRRGAIGQEITHHKEFGERLFAWGVLREKPVREYQQHLGTINKRPDYKRSSSHSRRERLRDRSSDRLRGRRSHKRDGLV